jgi:hypothetical protein
MVDSGQPPPTTPNPNSSVVIVIRSKPPSGESHRSHGPCAPPPLLCRHRRHFLFLQQSNLNPPPPSLSGRRGHAVTLSPDGHAITRQSHLRVSITLARFSQTLVHICHHLYKTNNVFTKIIQMGIEPNWFIS